MSVCFQFAEKGTCRFGDRCRFEHVKGAKKPGQAKKTKKKSRGLRFQTTHQDHIAEFFAAYPQFDYDDSEPFIEEFYRMCDSFDWDRDSEEKASARDDLRDAMVQQFNEMYGTDANDIESWGKLCEVIAISPIPVTLKGCQSAVISSHINICDLLDAPILGHPPKRFPSEVALSKYTKSAGKFFPRDDVNAGSLLRFLLRHIMNPRAQ